MPALTPVTPGWMMELFGIFLLLMSLVCDSVVFNLQVSGLAVALHDGVCRSGCSRFSKGHSRR